MNFDKLMNKEKYVCFSNTENFLDNRFFQKETSLTDNYKIAESNLLNLDFQKKYSNIHYFFKDEIFKLPIELYDVVNCLKKYEKILSLNDNWDGNGEIGFVEDTWKGVVTFLISYSIEVFNKFNEVIDIPKIYPSAEGSIDLDWETDKYGLLINISQFGKIATFYADDKAKQKVEGEFDPNNFNINLLPRAIS